MIKKEQLLFILRAQTGDKEAYNKLLQSIEKSLYWYISHTLTDKSHTKDILQEVFIIIYKKLPKLRDPELFKPWAYRITTREIFRFIKKRKLLNEHPMENDYFDTSSIDSEIEVLDLAIINILFDVISFLPPASRTVITLHYKNNLSISEISEVLNISTGTVKSRLSYGLKVLRDRLNKNNSLKGALNEN